MCARLIAAALLCIVLDACSTIGYYTHVAHGEISLLAHREPVAKIVADERRDATLRKRLAETQDARRFASAALGVPDNGSYTTYVDLGRPYVTWNVFATPALSVDPLTHCFAFAGCVAYVGYFDKARATDAAARLAAAGNDTAIEGAAAYSTLGWFADPILSSMLRWDDDELDGTIFHELAHQLIYVADDTAFNESFATFVQQQGLREWRVAQNRPPPDPAEGARDDAFTALILDLRERLRTLYGEAGGEGTRDRRVPRALPRATRRRMGRRCALRCLGRCADQQRAARAVRAVRSLGAGVRTSVRRVAR
jgi:predicted aminopeptidase